MPTIIKPTIGRVVWYWPADRPRRDDTQPFAAMIAYVHGGDKYVNLGYLMTSGGHDYAKNVRLKQEGELGIAPNESYCEWMPYQINLASRGLEELAKQPSDRAGPVPAANLAGVDPAKAAVKVGMGQGGDGGGYTQPGGEGDAIGLDREGEKLSDGKIVEHRRLQADAAPMADATERQAAKLRETQAARRGADDDGRDPDKRVDAATKLGAPDPTMPAEPHKRGDETAQAKAKAHEAGAAYDSNVGEKYSPTDNDNVD